MGGGVAGPRRLEAICAALFVALLAACSSLPPQPDQTFGPAFYDRSTRTLYVRAEPYHVPPSVNTVRLRQAATVLVTWEQQGERRVVQRYSVTEYRDEMLGRP